jgi:hypothetical protein
MEAVLGRLPAVTGFLVRVDDTRVLEVLNLRFNACITHGPNPTPRPYTRQYTKVRWHP